MTKPDPFKAFFEAGEAPAVDPAFRAALMQRIAQRRLQFDLLRSGLAGLAVFFGLLLVGPLILSLSLSLLASLHQAVLVLAITGLAVFAGYCLLTRGVRLPGWVDRWLET